MIGNITAPCQVVTRGTLLERSDSIHPPVTRNKITAGESYIRIVYPFQGCPDITAQTVPVSERRIRTINTAVDTSFQIPSKNIPVDVTYDTLKINFYAVH
jgi:hypothetical protein